MENSDIFSAPFLITNSGVPFVLGMAVGYFTKKMFRTALFLGGGLIVVMLIAEKQGVIANMNSAILDSTTHEIINTTKNSIDFLVARLSSFNNGVSGASSVGGFFVGFKIA